MKVLSNRIEYEQLSKKQKEIYNFQKVSAILAEYGFATVKLSDDKGFADFLAIHFLDRREIKVQLKSRAFEVRKDYLNKELYICFCECNNNDEHWYLFPHDEVVKKLEPQLLEMQSWKTEGKCWESPVSAAKKKILQDYLLK